MLFFESEDTEVFKAGRNKLFARNEKAGRNKLFARNEKQTGNHTLMLVMLHSDMSVVCTYHNVCRGVLFHEKLFWCHRCSLLIFVAEKSW